MTAKRSLALVIGGVLAAMVAAALLLQWPPFGADGAGLDEDDDGTVVEAAVGEQIVLRLKGNPTTGYTWEVTGFDPAVLVPAGEPDYQSSSDADGSGGRYTFRFDAVGRGETTVTLVYHRSWEDAAPVGTFSFTAVVQ